MQPNESIPLALLEFSAASLDITETQRKQIEQSYSAVGKALCESSLLEHLSPVISPQGSGLLGTVVKPAPDAPFDIDAICCLPLDYTRFLSGEVFNLVFRALRNHGTYKNLVTPKNRCVRVEYANSFHLDMTPCVPNSSRTHAIHVPDRELKIWKPSNPKLYASMFEEVAAKYPTIDSEEIRAANVKEAFQQGSNLFLQKKAFGRNS